jgi:hypothetical protein
MFADAAQKDPDEPRHIVCQSYAEYLLDDLASAELTFKKALSTGTREWFDEPTLSEQEMFPIPADKRFSAAVRKWRRSLVSPVTSP